MTKVKGNINGASVWRFKEAVSEPSNLQQYSLHSV